MIEELSRLLSSHRHPAYLLFNRLSKLQKRFLIWSDIVQVYEQFNATESGRGLNDTPLEKLMRLSQEGVVLNPLICLAVRLHVATWRYVEINVEDMHCREVDVVEYLSFKERAARGRPSSNERWVLELDLSPFERGFPKMKENRSIGRGVEYLNRYLSGRLFEGGTAGLERMFEFLKVHQVRGQQLMLNGEISDLTSLREALRAAAEQLQGMSQDAELTVVNSELRKLGFEPGWGRDVARTQETMELLTDILEAPSPDDLARFLSRLPMMFRIAVISPHGFFGQSGVLGKPDTGGQVVYILDQVRALEREMKRAIHEQGLDVEPQILIVTRMIPDAEGTTCDQRLESVVGTEHARILRVPFRDSSGRVVRPWISRFKVWPYLERFAVDAEREIMAELDGRPDFLVGNYSDGNLVASILSHRMGVTQCNIAHALEKTKYSNSDVLWRDYEDEYHFSAQYTADLISMNTADFIITSTYHEIAGTRGMVGQYESYSSFTMPGLYRVIYGIDCFDPKFNIVSPGADADTFFPCEDERRSAELAEELRSAIFGDGASLARGHLSDPDKPLIFAMSRLDHVKNMAGLVQWYAESPELREKANLLLIGGSSKPTEDGDGEELEQFRRIEELVNVPALDGFVRWFPSHTDRLRAGELYRCVAETRGIFVQPALFEAFGLTVIEAMSSGLPTFATCFGGPLEVIEDGVSGFHIDPHLGEEATTRMIEFFERCERDPDFWRQISENGLERVRSAYTWELYASKLLSLSRIYGFWKHITNIERQETRRYLEMFFGLMYRPLAQGNSQSPPDSIGHGSNTKPSGD
jgi:sucrose synthase